MVCKNCGKYIPDDSEECPFCGTNSPKAKVVKVKKRIVFKICPKCGYKNSYKEFYCQSCNYDLSKETPTEDDEHSSESVAAGLVLCIIIVGIIALVMAFAGNVNKNKNDTSSAKSTQTQYQTTAPVKTTTRQTTTTAYEWKLSTSSTGKDWNSVNDTEKEVWCSNSIAAWRLMGYDIPSNVTVSSMKKAINDVYSNSDYESYDLVTISEMFAVANNIY